MRILIPTLLLSTLVGVALVFLNAMQPQIVEDLRIQLGLATPGETVSPEEMRRNRSRVQMIDALLISDINKRDLREGRPFWGAAQHMIALAMSTDADNSIVRAEGDVFYEFQYFSFGGKRDPITFEFHNNQLFCVHFWKERKTQCGPGKTSFYATEGFPFTEAVTAPVPVQP